MDGHDALAPSQSLTNLTKPSWMAMLSSNSFFKFTFMLKSNILLLEQAIFDRKLPYVLDCLLTDLTEQNLHGNARHS
jgi:hypothetical protein